MRNSICSDGMCSDRAVGEEGYGFHTFTYILLSGLEVQAKDCLCVCFFLNSSA